MTMIRLLVAALAAGALAACTSAPTARSLAEEALTAMGGVDRVRAIQIVQMKDGKGTRYRLGQTVKAGDAESAATLMDVVETFDLAGGRASLDYRITTATGFTQHRREVLARRDGRGVGLEYVAGRPLAVMSPTGLFSWGTQNSPAIALRRQPIAILLAAAASTSNDRARDRDLDGHTYRFATVTLAAGDTVGLYFDPESRLLTAFEATDTETMLGDVPALYVLDDYREVGGVRLPHRITIRKGGQPYSEVQFASASIDDPAAYKVFDIPSEAGPEINRAIAVGDYSPIALTEVASAVHFARAYSHHSLVVEFPSFLAVVEAPYTEAQSRTLARLLASSFSGKPIRYIVPTHHHYDHIGGLRGLAAEGGTVLVEKRHQVAIRNVLDAPHTNPPDELERLRRAGRTVANIELFEGRHVITEGNQRLELYAITGNPHADPIVIAYTPSGRVLFQSDLYVPGTGGPAGPEAVHLLQSVRTLKLRVDTNVGGHGGVAPFAELVKAAAAAGTN
jgi:glyoxylase-like metal-dependent hydrolase (beta-lactamase superfamily II)